MGFFFLTFSLSDVISRRHYTNIQTDDVSQGFLAPFWIANHDVPY